VAPQALTMMNSEFMLRQAGRLAGRAAKAADPVRELWRLALQRDPTEDEARRAAAFLDDADALRRLALVLFNLNEFLYLD
jgi:hypothetical protein